MAAPDCKFNIFVNYLAPFGKQEKTQLRTLRPIFKKKACACVQNFSAAKIRVLHVSCTFDRNFDRKTADDFPSDFHHIRRAGLPPAAGPKNGTGSFCVFHRKEIICPFFVCPKPQIIPS